MGAFDAVLPRAAAKSDSSIPSVVPSPRGGDSMELIIIFMIMLLVIILVAKN